VLDAVNEVSTEYRSKIVFLCASTLNSAGILMRSATDVWPDGLGSSSGELGHNLMDHHFRVGAAGVVDDPAINDKYYFGRRPTGFYIPRYRNVPKQERDYMRGFGYQGSVQRNDWRPAVAELGVGADFKDRLTMPGDWRAGATAFGEMLPNHDNRVSIDTSRTDKWGLPVLAIDCEIGENEKRMRVDMKNDMAETLDAAGVRDVHPYESDYAPGMGIHEMGAARMGRDPKTSVLNGWNQVWDAPNVFVTDGACMVSSGCQNPSLTYMALTARAADHAVNELKRMNL
jgi:choline dehydrogenase-like flavoprotein